MRFFLCSGLAMSAGQSPPRGCRHPRPVGALTPAPGAPSPPPQEHPSARDRLLNTLHLVSSLFQKAKKESFHKPPPTSPKSPYYSKPRKVASWRALRTAASMPLGHRMSLTPQKLWLGSAKQGRVLGTPVYREKEDMYDEIIELKKSLRMQKSEVDLMRTKLRRLEEEKSRKDRQIEQLLDPSRGPGSARTPAEDRPETGWVVSGLKQRILKLEQQCKDKDNTIHKLQTDIKTTNLEEMKIAMETYYEEIHRLQTLLASSETTGRKYDDLSGAGAPMRASCSTPSSMAAAGPRPPLRQWADCHVSTGVAPGCPDNRPVLTADGHCPHCLAALVPPADLPVGESSAPSASSCCRMSLSGGAAGWPSSQRPSPLLQPTPCEIGPMESPKPQSSDEARSDLLAHAASSSAGHGQPPAGHLEESERVRAAVRSLKGERRALRAQLQDRDLEVKQLLQAKIDLQRELESVKEGEKERREREGALRVAGDITFSAVRAFHLRTSCKPCPPPPGETNTLLCPLSQQAAAVLQAAFRGHLARAELVSRQAWDSESSGMPSLPCQDSPPPCVPSPIVQAEDDPGQEEAITTIQSVLRAHLARIGHRATSKRASTAASAKRRPLCSGPAFPGKPIRFELRCGGRLAL
ncbi:IQ domain-containing protein E [Pteropus vampyrus]|uniref:IQ domain-containing protein E n=1 Tax=Pteropus vampyrus TaxID=132908 RepID=A0A6P6CM13_PTEVA|nr:IQ domain-containing protein E [Pteropus vampyrus]